MPPPFMPAAGVRRLPAALAALAAAALLAACAGAPRESLPTPEQRLAREGLRIGAEVDRIPSFRISRWSDLDRRHVVVDDGLGRNYLITTAIDCDELDTANVLGYTATGGDLTRFDRLVIRGVSGQPLECPIQALHALEAAPRP